MIYSLGSRFNPRATIKKRGNSIKVEGDTHITNIRRLSDTINLQSQKILNYKPKNNTHQVEWHTQRRKSEPSCLQQIEEFPDLQEAKHRSKLFYKKLKLKPDFAYCLKRQQGSHSYEFKVQNNAKQKEWWHHTQARKECLRIYEQQNQSFRKQMECLNRIKGRIKILKDIKQQKLRLLKIFHNQKH